MASKIFIGNGKEKKFDNGGSIISVTLDIDDLIREYNQHGFLNRQNKRTMRIDVSTRRAVGEYGDTHSVTVNTWHSDSFMTPNPIEVTEHKKAIPEISEEDDIPF